MGVSQGGVRDPVVDGIGVLFQVAADGLGQSLGLDNRELPPDLKPALCVTLFAVLVIG